MKKVISLILVTVMLCTSMVFAQPFSDVAGHWAEEEIGKAYDSGSVNGNPDGTFRPDATISRAEFLKMLTALICAKLEVTIPAEYGDDSHWASIYYNFAVQQMYYPLGDDSKVGNVVPGKMSVNDFDLPIERWEMSFLTSECLKNVFGIRGADIGDSFSDAEETADAYPTAVTTAVVNNFLLGIMTGDENGNLNPQNNGTRAEAVVIINRVGTLIQNIIDEAEASIKEYEEQINASLKTYENIPKGHPRVTILMENNKKIVLELYPEYAPQTVANFVELAKSGFYDGLTFHRVVENFMAQGGDPNGDGSGGSEHNIVGEFSANGFTQNTLSHTKGVISMARAQHFNSASSQFFICYSDVPFLDGQYAAFGKVVSGMDVVEDFLDGELLPNSSGEIASPKKPIVMKKVTVK